MSATIFQSKSMGVLEKIQSTQMDNIKKASELMAKSIYDGKLVHTFGSGHSALPALDIFPRYGSYVGFHPVVDPRLIWHSAIGPGGARELLWIERQEGYIKNFLQSYTFSAGSTFIVYSHGGANAAPIEAGLYAREQKMNVVAITSMDNYRNTTSKHSSGKCLADTADVVIDNCVPLEDSLVEVEGQIAKVAACSSITAIFISMSLVAETAQLLRKMGVNMPTFVSPNVDGIAPSHNDEVYAEYTRYVKDQKI